MSIFKLQAEPAGTLCNMEVFRFVKEELELSKQKSVGPNKEYSGLLEQLVEYFEMTHITEQTEERLDKVIEEAGKLGLSKNETLQVINLKPKSQLEIQLIVEDCESRLSDEQVEKFLALCEANL